MQHCKRKMIAFSRTHTIKIDCHQERAHLVIRDLFRGVLLNHPD